MPRLVMNHDRKETAIEFVRAKGTLKAGANAAGVTYQTLRNEIKRSPIFAKRIAEALNDGKSEIGNTAIDNIIKIASDHNPDVRSRLTANLALANWAIPGFRGETRIGGKIEHDIRVTSAVPRPIYKEIEIEKKPIQIGTGKKAEHQHVEVDKISQEDKLHHAMGDAPQLMPGKASEAQTSPPTL